MKRESSWYCNMTLRAIGILLVCLIGCGPADEPEPTIVVPIDPEAEFSGKTHDEWALEWWRWIMTQPYPTCEEGYMDPDGSNCAVGQEDGSPVFFLAHNDFLGHVGRSDCVAPSGKAIFFPIITARFDNAGVAASDAVDEEQLLQAVNTWAADVRGLSLEVDGQQINISESYLVRATTFSYTLPEQPNFFGCFGAQDITGTIDTSVIGGYFVMLPPLSPGSYLITFYARNLSEDFQVDQTYDLVVEDSATP